MKKLMFLSLLALLTNSFDASASCQDKYKKAIKKKDNVDFYTGVATVPVAGTAAALLLMNPLAGGVALGGYMTYLIPRTIHIYNIQNIYVAQGGKQLVKADVMLEALLPFSLTITKDSALKKMTVLLGHRFNIPKEDTEGRAELRKKIEAELVVADQTNAFCQDKKVFSYPKVLNYLEAKIRGEEFQESSSDDEVEN